MIIGIGTDLVRIERIQRSLDRFGERFVKRVFSDVEYDYCMKRKEVASCLAKRFAAKEAFVKALGKGMREGIWFKDICVVNDIQGAPSLQLSGVTAQYLENRNPLRIHLSLSDEGGLAQAVVILEQD